ncbi:unnamed protein product [Chondrus crispus]|uniref:Uncharacterized protein n=1 Tax=Chondrus crispus TaxID=2769 RepID=R7QP43_CHOCR|nr:unnamed protein product [Chondrus crispus]CDF39256.1 unnamed protein product [Chondrus crispus]|eukprot:XP_005719167.1 unnamed protein product [Chondrus crispus]
MPGRSALRPCLSTQAGQLSPSHSSFTPPQVLMTLIRRLTRLVWTTRPCGEKWALVTVCISHERKSKGCRP